MRMQESKRLEIPEWLDESQVSALITIKVKTLQNWRCAGRGLPFHKLGGKVRYKKADVLAYIAQRRHEPISNDTY
jgi:predicted site-specific integrase-resolvase